MMVAREAHGHLPDRERRRRKFGPIRVTGGAGGSRLARRADSCPVRSPILQQGSGRSSGFHAFADCESRHEPLY
jgi:hypothetical protein